MRLSQLVGRTIKETPRDAELPSHVYLVRAGYIRQFSAGIYGLLPLAYRSIQKIENIIRQEMNAVEGQEVKMPCMMTKELWEETNRYNIPEMFHLNDRNEKPMVLGMTHEEPVTAFARTELTSYKQLPATLYQFQTKFRDEARPRGGLIRLREFMMKDAYSFHASEEDLKEYYDRMHEAYRRVFTRSGCKNFVSVLSDNGMFGGKYSHEFMMLVPSGEDTLITCPACSYKANQEIAKSLFVLTKNEEQPLEKISTPEQKTIEQLATFLNLLPEQTAKAVLFKTEKNEPIVAFIRGDLEVNEMKLRVIVQSDLQPATPDIIALAGACAGSTGPIGLNLKKCRIVIDKSVEGSSNLVTGANEDDFHFKNFNFARDLLSKLTDQERKHVLGGDIAIAKAGDPCPECQTSLQATRGIEIGNIFHLGTRYSKSMNAVYLDRNGKTQNHIMGCYGIGVTRLLPAVVEESHDDKGMILPLPIAPFELHMNVLNLKDPAVKEASQKLYNELIAANIEVLMDDRDEKPGSQFADADLIGIPFRIILSPKTLAENSVEFKHRDGRKAAEKMKLDGLIADLKTILADEYKRFEP